MGNGRNQRVVFGPFSFSLDTGQLSKGGTPLRLEDKPARLLAILIKDRPALVTRDRLQALLWPDGVHLDFDHGLHKCVNKLRTVLNDDPNQPRYIETLSRRGYRFMAPVTYEDGSENLEFESASSTIEQKIELASATVQQPASTDVTPGNFISTDGKRGISHGKLITAALAGVLALSLIYWLRQKERSHQSAVETAPRITSLKIEKDGGEDPEEEGFKVYSIGDFRGSVVRNLQNNGMDRWKVTSGDQGYYFRSFTPAEKQFVRGRDWTLTCICAVKTGGAWSVVDFGDNAGEPRFDIELLQEGPNYYVALTQQISPVFEMEKIEFPGAGDVDHPHTYELRYDHTSKTASLWIDGKRMATGYRGHYQFRENAGLLFGSGSYLSAKVGIGVFRKVRFQVN